MKYIRTKDRIYKFGKIGLVGKEMEKDFFERPSNSIFESEIINQADTIEELCDEFVWYDKKFNDFDIISIDKVKKTFQLIRDDFDFDLEYELKKEHNTIYGAIWTDKGLIYVAKMNEKGELCLI